MRLKGIKSKWNPRMSGLRGVQSAVSLFLSLSALWKDAERENSRVPRKGDKNCGGETLGERLWDRYYSLRCPNCGLKTRESPRGSQSIPFLMEWVFDEAREA